MKKKWTAEAYLAHSGIIGMHWGERRYQNADGSLTPLGRSHYGVGPPRGSNKDDRYRRHLEKGIASSERKMDKLKKKYTKVQDSLTKKS